MTRLLILGLLALLLCANGASARGGGGCLAEGTAILTPDGPAAIETLKPGDAVYAVEAGQRLPARVVACYRVDPEVFLELHIGKRVVRVTGEHPFQVAPGCFRSADALQPGDELWHWNGERFTKVRLDRKSVVRATCPAFNLTVRPGATYIADGIAVHNKGGGCFLPGTPVLRDDGTTIPIENLQPGDGIRAFTADGTVVTTRVRRLLTHDVDRYASVTTPGTRLQVTGEHPFFVGAGNFRSLEALQVGDTIFVHDASGLRPEPIEAIQWLRGRTRVYNLQTDAPHTYFAAGVAVHNKGGGGGGGGGRGGGSGGFVGGGVHRSSGGHSSHSSSDDSDWTWLWIVGIIAFVFGVPAIFLLLANRRSSSGAAQEQPDLDFVFPAADVAARAARTRKLLDFLTREDPAFAPEQLQARAREVFERLQPCWQAREYEPLRADLMPPLFVEHVGQLQAMRRSHEINRIDQLQIEDVAIVHVRYTKRLDRREFTALITASARDYYVDDRNNNFLRGDPEPTRFQEFWTFQRQGERWLLRDIEQSRDSDLLRQENVVETLSAEQLQESYGQEAPSAGPAGPWLETGVAVKETRVERLLNFLAQRDRMWDRTKMLERARDVFLEVFFAQESADLEAVSEDMLFPEVAEDLRRQIQKRHGDGVGIEFRNLCIRKIELVLVRNYMRDENDEFVVRIRAHAQKILRRGDTVVSKDPDVMPFEQYWSFRRAGMVWKLRDILPPARGRQAVTEENVDEDSTREQLDWYYTQPHA